MGSIEVFASQAGMTARRRLVLAAAPPFGHGYDYAAGNTLLRLGCQYTPPLRPQSRRAVSPE